MFFFTRADAGDSEKLPLISVPAQSPKEPTPGSLKRTPSISQSFS
jgi:hypothetical protein